MGDLSLAFRMKYRYALGISVMVWFDLYLSQAAVERNPDRERPERRIRDAYLARGRPSDAICTADTVQEVTQCAKDLIALQMNGFPWSMAVPSQFQNQIRNQQNRNDNLTDPLDPINRMCDVFEDFLGCLDQHAITNVCLLSGERFRCHIIFQFICHVQQRSTDLLHSLQCLQESRVLDLLIIHLAGRPGTHINDMAQGNVNSLFRLLNRDGLVQNYTINPLSVNRVVITGLICLPESVISQDVSFIIDRKCGSHAAELAVNFYLYFRTRFNSVLGKIGFTSNICDKPSGRDYATPTVIESDGTSTRLFDRFLEENSPGTAMDTAFGHDLGAYLKSIPAREFCNPLRKLRVSFLACVLLSYDPSGKASFNILQYAHSVLYSPFTPSPDSSSLTIFRSCYNLLRQVCGANATYFEYEYLVSAGSRAIQRMMTNLTCEWQDMVMRLYIEASEHGNIWPTGYNAPARPMCLSNGIYTFGRIASSMSDLFYVVSQGAKEISAKCSITSAKRIKMFYRRLKYAWYTEIKLLYMMQEAFP